MIDVTSISGDAEIRFVAQTRYEPSSCLVLTDGNRLLNYGSRPVNRDTNQFGDKSCYHLNWQGSIAYIPYGMFSTWQNFCGLNCAVVSSGGNTYYLGIFYFPGKSTHVSYSYTYGKTLYYVVIDASWEGLALCIRTHCRKSAANGITSISWENYAETRLYSRDYRKVAVASTGSSGQSVWIDYPFPKVSATPYAVPAIVPHGVGQSSTSFIDMFYQRIGDYESRLPSYLPGIPSGLYGELANSCAQNARLLSINSIAYASDLVKLARISEEIRHLLKAQANPKEIANLWLSYKYGVRLTVHDTMKLVQAVTQAGKHYSYERATSAASQSQLTHAPYRGIFVDSKYYYKLYYRPVDNALLSTCRSLMDWDVFPSLQNVWDLIPFSFVADWFVDISSTLDRIDTRTYFSTLSIASTIRTRKSTFHAVPLMTSQSLGNLGTLSGNVDLTVYDRQLAHTADLPLLFSGSPRQFNNYLELGAILVKLFTK